MIYKSTHHLARAGDVHEVEGEGLELVLVQALEPQHILVEGQRLGGVLDLPSVVMCVYMRMGGEGSVNHGGWSRTMVMDSFIHTYKSVPGAWSAARRS